MRILDLTIRNVRGLRDLTLDFKGQNLVIWGPNGSGKSAVVDAIDFLLSGKISRLIGPGTKGISLAKHGPHIDHAIEDAEVRATVKVPGHDDPITITRRLARPEELECPEGLSETFQRIRELASRGQHVLTRRDMLRFVSVEGRTRAQNVQALLDLTQVEDIRRTLVSVANTLNDALGHAKRAVEQSRSDTCAALGLEEFDEAAVLGAVNLQRGSLGGAPITALASKALQKDIETPHPTASTENSVDLTLIQKDIDHLNKLLKNDIADVDEELRRKIKAFEANPGLKHALSHLELTEQGLSLLDESGNCPLCETEWESDTLKPFLQERQQAGREADQFRKDIDKLASRISAVVKNLRPTVSNIASSAAALTVGESEFKEWASKLGDLADALEDPLRHYPTETQTPEAVLVFLAPDGYSDLLKELLSTASDRSGEPSVEVAAWATLERLKGCLESLERASVELGSANELSTRGAVLRDTYVQARDAILESLYSTIAGRFVELYTQLHPEEAEQFTAALEASQASLDLQVDFFGRGTHPPHALHSEGHQDSMGLCLFLALSEYLSAGTLELIILDDVIMSVDIDHRQHVARLLAGSFAGHQFLITTHDRTWARQLRMAGAVTTRNVKDFWRWTIETGPMVDQGPDMWERIDEDLAREDVNGAAHKLRLGCERDLETVCDSLGAKVVYRSDGRWDLGAFLRGTASEYKAILKQAKQAAQSWGNAEAVARLEERDSIRAQVYDRLGAEQWSVDAHIHHSKWANLSPAEFSNVVDAFRDLLALFRCAECGQLIEKSHIDLEAVAVTCVCGTLNWNLRVK